MIMVFSLGFSAAGIEASFRATLHVLDPRAGRYS